jgi:hypothetical protein
MSWGGGADALRQRLHQDGGVPSAHAEDHAGAASLSSS